MILHTDKTRRKAVWGPKRTLAAAVVLILAFAAPTFAAGREHARAGGKARDGRPNSLVTGYKADKELTKRSRGNGSAKTRVIVELQPGAQLPPAFRGYMRRNGKLGIINGQVLELPNRLIAAMSQHPDVFRLHFDRPTTGANYRTALTTGTRVVQKTLGLTGAGVGVAVIDSGITSWHDDLTDGAATATAYSPSRPFGNQRVAAFVDFVNGQVTPYDDLGHGTHVAGIIAGNGYDSHGQKAGSAPDATLVSLKVLNAQGSGNISDIIAALDWVLAHHLEYNIRVVNMSVGAQIHESYWTDPLTLAAKRVVDAGVVVVTAAGNWGKNSAGQPVWGGIAAPGNAPWVLTVGASSTNGTPRRGDDTMGTYSSRGPTYLDWGAKPDITAPGTGTVSLSTPGSTYFTTHAAGLLPGADGGLEYLSLSGTSMAAPVVSGVVAQMLQVNPSLTPNAVKAILEYTAQKYPNYKPLEQGAGFLNAVGAVRLARFYASAQPGQRPPVQRMWSKHVIWGSHYIGGGFINPSSNAYAIGTNWGVAKTDDGDNIIWGTDCSTADCDNIIWGTDDGDNIIWGTEDNGDNIIWGTDDGDNIVWGTDCGGADCDNIIWGTEDGDNIIWGTADEGDNIVWGTAGLDADNIIWGTDDGDNIIWGTDDGDNIIWGTDDGDNIIWGTDDPGDNIIWGTDDGDNIIWGTADGDNIIWGTAGSLNPVWESSPDGTRVQVSGPALFDRFGDRKLLRLMLAAVRPVPPPVTTNDSAPPPPADPPPAPPADTTDSTPPSDSTTPPPSDPVPTVDPPPAPPVEETVTPPTDPTSTTDTTVPPPPPADPGTLPGEVL